MSEREARERSTPEQNAAAKELLFGHRYSRPREEPRCGVCGHYRWQHRPVEDVFGPRPRSDGSLVFEFTHGPCGNIERSNYHTGRPCGCRLYVHDCFPRVTELLGFEARSAIERATGARPVPRTIPTGDYQEGDLITVSYGGITRAHRVVHVGRRADGNAHYTYDLEPVE